MTSAGPRRLRSLCCASAITLAIVLVEAVVHAEPAPMTESDESQAPPTFIYEQPHEKDYLRSVVELEAVLLVGVLYYLTTADRNWDLQYRWETYERKFRWDAFGPDENHFGTNFIGHPLGGAGYYLAARSNRQGVFESAAFAVAGSLLWEYFGEITERVSMNDMVITPMAGIAIGEPMLQLGAFFDRSAPSTTNRVLGSVFGPFKSFNDWADGLEPHRTRAGWPQREWHRFELTAATVVSSSSASSSRAGVQLAASERLARLPHYDEAGQHGFWFDDGNVTGMDLELTFSALGVSDIMVNTRAMLAGYYSRNARAHGDGVRGGGVVVGPSVAFEYAQHDYGRGEGDPVDRISFAQPIALSVLNRVGLGPTHLATEVHAGPAMAGVTAHAHGAYMGNTEELPAVLDLHRYYFGVGGEVVSAARLQWKRLELLASVRADRYEVLQDRPPTGNVAISDLRVRGSAQAGVSIPNTAAVVRVLAKHFLRTGAMGAAHSETQEFTWGVSFGGVF